MQQGEGEPLPVSWGEPAPEDTPDTALGMDIQVGDDEDSRWEALLSRLTVTSQPAVPTPASSFSKRTTHSSDLSCRLPPPPTTTPPVSPPTIVLVAPARR